MTKIIAFYSPRDEWGFLSNFYALGFKDDNGLHYETSEHYYQAHKFVGTDHFDIIRTAPTPKMAANGGRNPLRPLRKDWEYIKVLVMLDALRFKFREYKKGLLETGNAILVEASPKDSYWGWGADRKGLNMLGICLMIVRRELQK